MRILLIEDDAVDAKATQRSLRIAFPEANLDWLSDTRPEDAAQIIAAGYDCILLDYRLPSCSGTELVERLHADTLEHRAVVMLTGAGNERVAVEAMKAGAEDYLRKDEISPDLLRWIVLEAMERVRLQHQIEDYQRQAEHLAVSQARAAALEHSNRELREFAYVASHDLQEPLRTVTSYLQLLQRRYQGRLDADADEFIGYAVDGATRMKRLINDLLLYARVDNPRKEMAPASCEDALAQALNNLRATIEEAGAVVTHDPLPAVLSDESQIAQLFQNLIGNAIKFCKDASPIVHISAAPNPEGDILFAVHDNGIGIDPQYYERIFAICRRLHGNNDYPGTGIGLSVCQKIVQRHGGRIWVESQPGQGATFYFTLPGLVDDPR